MDEKDLRIEELQDQIIDLSLRHSALEWIVEQHFSHYLLTLPDDEAHGFLMGLSHAPLGARRFSEEGERDVRPDHEARLWAHIRHIAGKIDERRRQGLRRG